MSAPKTKPKMDTPKESGRQRGVVKDARDLLTQHYATQAAARQPSTRGGDEGEGFAEYAAGKLEGAERDALHTTKQTAGRAVREYRNRTKAAKAQRKNQQHADTSAQPAEGGTRHESGRLSASGGHPSTPDRPLAPDGANSARPEAVQNPSVNPGAAHAKRQLQEQRGGEQLARSPYHVGRAGPVDGTAPAGGSPATAKVGSSPIKTKESALGTPGKATKGRLGIFKQRANRVKTAGTVRKGIKKAAPSGAAKETFKRSQQIAKATKAAAKKAGEMLLRVAAAIGRAIVSVAAACGPLVVIIVALAVVGAIIASPFGLFFSGEDENSTTAMQQTISDISAAYRENLLHIIADNNHDELRFLYTNRGYQRTDNWIDVLAVYAVKTADPDDGMEVITLDPERIEKLKAVFWDMQDVTSEVVNEPKYDAETDTSTDHYVLYIRATCIGAWEMADAYGFDRQQRDILEEMLNGAYDSYFAAMIGSAGLFTAIGDGGAVVGNGNFMWPSDASTYVRSPYGSRPGVGVGDFHYGIDIAAGENTNVLASDGGTVISNSVHYSYGNHLLVDHGNGTQTLYGHMNAVFFSVGDNVEQGQVIGLCGNTGVSYGAHIHFEIRINGNTVDPLQYFDNYTTAW